VTLVEQYTPGHVRAASGGENRLIRFSHGADDWYTHSARRALELWRELESESGADLFVPAGVAWFFRDSLAWAEDSERALRSEGIPVERMTPAEAAGLFPSFDADGIETALYEPDAGLVRARDATRVTAEQAIARGARLVEGAARPAGGALEVGGCRLEADFVVWAGGAWLAHLFPDLVRLTVTRQDVFFFGAPPEWQAPQVPAWVDFDEAIYGTADLDGRGFKAAPDAHGPEFDPDGDDRLVSDERQREARDYVERRFPALADAPLVGSRACPYSLTEDHQFLVAPHPEHDHVWLLGGGSGHGFKHGPALAEYVEGLLKGEELPDPRFRLGPREAGGGLRTAGRTRS
jgi:sarcosine oxidase